MEILVLTALLSPLFGFLILSAFSYIIDRRGAEIIGCTTVFVSFALFVYSFLNLQTENLDEISFKLFSWIELPSLDLTFSLHLDTLALLMTLIITGVGFLIHLYSIGYMEHEVDYARYFGCLNFFVFAMLLLVLAGNLVLLFFGWEGVGLASYLLIGFWYTRREAAKAATKAFVINRIGDAGFLIALLMTLSIFGTDDIQKISTAAKTTFTVGAPFITLLTLLYFIGATGKSAQLPLYTWLPDAMEGPTPVSALIHAATMVTAGVYLVVRLHNLFELAPLTMQIIGIIGGATALFAALCALAQTDLKRVLAYSTVSQLGYMFLACGAGAFYAAMFHLTSHAFIKALLFLAAGNVIHMLHGTQEMSKMGGLKKLFPVTNVLFFIGALALSGFPPFAAFLSKDLILEEEYLLGYHTLFVIGLITALLTGFYLFRAYILTFLGKPSPEVAALKGSYEAHRIMLIPVSILALLAIFGGLLGFSINKKPPLEDFLSESDVKLPSLPIEPGFHFSFEMAISVLFSILGVFIAYFVYRRYYESLGKPVELLKNAFYVNEIYEKIFVKPLKIFSQWINSFFEPKIFNGSLVAASQGIKNTSLILQKLQSGEIRAYAAWMAVGMVFLMVYLIF